MAQATRSGGKMAPPTVAQLKESPVDRVASWIVALLVLVGVLVGGMFSVWFSFKLAKPPQIAVPVRLDPGGGGDPNGVVGEKLNLEGPEREEIGQNSDVLEPAIQDTMQMLVDAAAKQVADVASDPVFNADPDAEPGGGGGSRGNSNRRGFGYGPGPGGGGGPAWEMKYDESTLTAYAQQLDFFKIELAVVGGTKDGIEYASGFQGSPSRRTGTRDAEQSLKPRRTYFTHTSGTVEKYDRQLLAKAGINAEGFGHIILQYYPKAAEDQLLIAQQQFQKLDQPAIKKTVFGIRPRQGGGFEFYVLSQIRR